MPRVSRSRPCSNHRLSMTVKMGSRELTAWATAEGASRSDKKMKSWAMLLNTPASRKNRMPAGLAVSNVR